MEVTKVLGKRCRAAEPLKWTGRLGHALPEDISLTDGMTALHLAARRGHGAVVRI